MMSTEARSTTPPSGRISSRRKFGIVVDRDRAGIGDAERVQNVGEIPVLALEDAELVEVADHALGRRHRRQQAPVGRRAHRQVVAHQRVQPVDRDELLGQAVVDAVVIDAAQRHAGERLVLADAADRAMQALGLEAPPVRLHADLERRMRQDRRRPFDGVDLRHQRGVDHARAVEQPIAVPVRIEALELVADRVVLAREQRVQQAEAGPPVARETGQRRLQLVVQGIGVEDQVVVVEIELAVGHELAGQHRIAVLDATLRPQPLGRLAVAAVDLRGVPPMRFGIGVGRRIFQLPAILRLFAFVIARRVGPRAADLHRAAALAPRIVVGERHLEGALGQPARRD